MADRNTYALLSARVYNTSETNEIFVPTGWTELPQPVDNGFTGLYARAYRNNATGEIVIAFRGTNTTISEGTLQDWATNLSAGLGIPNGQVAQAMQFYPSIKAQYGSNISFTGHSLGGGIASLMAVFFDKQATVFDEAQFQLTAVNPITVAAYGLLAPSALLDLNFLLYQLNPLSIGLIFNGREENVTNYFLEGEVVGNIRTGFNSIVGEGNDRIFTLGQSTAGAIDRHDMLVLTAAQYSSGFLNALHKLPNLLTQLLDKNLFAADRTTTKQDILSLLLRHQFGGSNTPADKMLDGFARDLNQLTPGGLIKDAPRLEDALITALMQGYDKLEQDGLSFTTDFYNGIPGGFYFDINRIAASFNQIRTANDLVTALQTYYGLDSTIALNGFDRWYLQAGPASLIAQDTAGKNDLMAGGRYADVLQGGAGDDLLLGGLGTDIYQYRPNDGNDTIIDTDGQGLLLYDPNGQTQALTVGLRRSTDPAGQYKSPDQTITYTWSGTPGTDLTITLPTGQLTVKDFSAGDLEIRLTNLPPIPTPGPTHVGAANPSPDAPGVPTTLAGGLAGSNAAYSGDTLYADYDATGDHWPPYRGVYGLGGDDYIKSHQDFYSSRFESNLPTVYNLVLDGGAGSDLLVAAHDNDTPPLDAPGITIYGDGPNAIPSGEGDHDVIDGSPMHDTLYAGPGHDFVVAGEYGNDYIDGGLGNDLVNGGRVSAGFVPRLYDGSSTSPGTYYNAIPALGYDYQLLVLNAQTWSRSPTLEADLATIGLTLTPDQSNQLNQIVSLVNQNQPNQAAPLLTSLSNSLRPITEHEARVLQELTLDRKAQALGFGPASFTDDDIIIGGPETVAAGETDDDDLPGRLLKQFPHLATQRLGNPLQRTDGRILRSVLQARQRRPADSQLTRKSLLGEALTPPPQITRQSSGQSHAAYVNMTLCAHVNQAQNTDKVHRHRSGQAESYSLPELQKLGTKNKSAYRLAA